jgi:sulfur carrier protein ThiS
MEVFIERQNRLVKTKFSGNVTSLLKYLKVNSEDVLVVRNGKLLTPDSRLSNGDSIRLLSVISGG